MVFLVYLYVIIVTVFAVWIGRPLIVLNFLNEKFNATYRYALVRLREFGESIAFYRGTAIERGNLLSRFASVIANKWKIIYRSLKYVGFNLSMSQMAVVFPFVVQAPRLFARQITLGDIIQSAQSFGQVHDALSFFRNSYDDFAKYPRHPRAPGNRLCRSHGRRRAIAGRADRNRRRAPGARSASACARPPTSRWWKT